jgi:hypothetical protein
MNAFNYKSTSGTPTHAVGTSVPSSTGGTTLYTPAGLVHSASKGAYSGRLAEMGLEATIVDVPKRGRGRPPKVSMSGASYDFSAFPSVKVPKWKGPVQKIVARV